jgi:hypothetical protein
MPCSDSLTSPVRSPIAARRLREYCRVSRVKRRAVRYTSGETVNAIRPSRQSTEIITTRVPTRVRVAGMRSVNRSSRLDSTVEVSLTTRLVSSPTVWWSWNDIGSCSV